MKKQLDLKEIGRVVTLVGSVLETVIGVIITVLSFGFGAIIFAPIIALSWTAREKALTGHQGFNIYGIIHGILFCWITAIGHILLFLASYYEDEKDDQ